MESNLRSLTHEVTIQIWNDKYLRISILRSTQLLLRTRFLFLELNKKPISSSDNLYWLISLLPCTLCRTFAAAWREQEQKEKKKSELSDGWLMPPSDNNLLSSSTLHFTRTDRISKSTSFSNPVFRSSLRRETASSRGFFSTSNVDSTSSFSRLKFCPS